jgi:hypothetical protein
MGLGTHLGLEMGSPMVMDLDKYLGWEKRTDKEMAIHLVKAMGTLKDLGLDKLMVKDRHLDLVKGLLKVMD